MVRRTITLVGLLFTVFVAMSGLVYAQTEATLSGSVTDESKAVLPGVTVTATDAASGRQYVSVSDERGEYRLPSMLPGTYRVQAELAGFTTVVVPRVELLVGQNATLPMNLRVATIQETVTVTGESPLINTQSVEVGSNIDRVQMEQLPIQGRNWMELSMLVKGVTANDVAGGRPGAAREDMFQLNLDGQQITQQVAGSGFGQPGLSREAIAEYQVLTNQYDITMGRSVGMQVQAISRAGTNRTTGSVYGYFRDDSWNAKDFVADRVLPYANQQTGFSLGGPISRDRVHYFGTYEYEREPQTIVSSPQLTQGQSLSLPTTLTKHNVLGRVDLQFGSNDHLVARANYSNFLNPFAQVGGGDHPTAGARQSRYAAIATANWSRVLSNAAVQEVRVGFYQYYWENSLAEGVPDTPQYILGGLNVGGRFNYPQWFQQSMPSARYDLNVHRGSHDFKIGGEYLHRGDTGWWPLNRRGQFTFNTMPNTVQATFGARFPLDAWNDASRWNLNGLDQYANRYGTTFSRSDDIDIPRKTWAIWAGDTWRTERLTINAGIRWDVDWGAMSPPGPGGEGEFQDIILPITNGFDPAGYDVGWKNGIRDLKNISPRVGASFMVDDTLVLRGGAGVFYSSQVSNLAFSNQLNNGQNVAAVQIVNDGLPGFLQDPLRGNTAEDYLSGRVPLPPQGLATIAHDYKGPRTYQVNVGFQKQVGAVLGFDSDLVFAKGKHLGLQRDMNIFYDPATGYPINPTTRPGVNFRPLPEYGSITMYDSKLASESLALASSVTRRFRDRWQGGLTYTYMFFSRDHGTGASGWLSLINNPFCIDCEWGRSADFQRHTLRINGVYQAPWGINASGIFSYGSGNYFNTTIAGNPFGTVGAVSSINRVNDGRTTVIVPETTTLNGETLDVRDRFDGPAAYAPGEHIPRNALKGFPLSKVDVRVSKDVFIPGSSVKLTGMLEVFNLFNHANYGSYNAIVGNAAFGRPVQNLNLSYLPRVVQLAFRVEF